MLQRMTRNDPADQYPERVDAPSDEYVVKARRTAARLAVAQGASPAELREVLEALGLIEPQKPAEAPKKPSPVSAPSKPPVRRAADGSGRFLPPERADPDLCPKQIHPWTPENRVTRKGHSNECRACMNATRRARAAVKRAQRPTKPVAEKPTKPGRGPRKCRSGKHLIPDTDYRCKPCHNESNQKRRAAERAERKRKANEAARLRVEESVRKARELLASIPAKELPEFDETGTPVPRCPRRIHLKGANAPRVSRGVRCLGCRQIDWAKATLQRFAGEEL